MNEIKWVNQGIPVPAVHIMVFGAWFYGATRNLHI